MLSGMTDAGISERRNALAYVPYASNEICCWALLSIHLHCAHISRLIWSADMNYGFASFTNCSICQWGNAWGSSKHEVDDRRKCCAVGSNRLEFRWALWQLFSIVYALYVKCVWAKLLSFECFQTSSDFIISAYV